MRYASVCDGIGAAHLAWQPLGWECAWTSEIEKFPIAVVDQRHGFVNLGDMTEITDEQIEEHGPIELLVGGTPCQSFSVAGLRKGMADPRGNLALTFLGLAERTRAEWVVWENVPGVLSSNEGRDFGSFLGALGKLGYGFAYRVLDAQYFGVPQRRRRVFVVGCLGGWQRAAAVLFERESLSGHPAPRREAGKGSAPTPAARTRGGGGLGTDFDLDGGLIPIDLRQSSRGAKTTNNRKHGTTGGPPGHGVGIGGDPAFTVSERGQAVVVPTAMGAPDVAAGHYVTHTLCAEGYAASEDGTGRGTPLVTAFDARQSDVIQYGEKTGPLDTHGQTMAVCFDETQITSAENPFDLRQSSRGASEDGTGRGTPLVTSVSLASDPIHAEELAQPVTARNGDPGVVAFSCKDHGADAGEVAPTLRAMGHDDSHANGGGQVAVCFDETQITSAENRCNPQPGDPSHPLAAGARPPTLAGPCVRRLTPRECERLQGFSDDFTLVEYRGKPACDGPRYKALGNSMAVPVMRWIGNRINKQEATK